jgi:class 3 adenylate cyclase
MATALRSGATAVFDVINELDRLVGTLLAKAGGADLAGDTARFMATFQNIYLGGAE